MKVLFSDSSDNEDTSDLWLLRTLHDTALRSHYTYQLVKKLLRSEERTLLEEMYAPLGIAASVIGLFAYIENPSFRDLVLILYILSVLLLVVALVVSRRLKRSDLDDVTYLGIYLGETLNSVNELKLGLNRNQDDKGVTEFIEDTKDRLKGTIPYVRQTITRLKKNGTYPACLVTLGRSESWVNKLDQDVKSLVGRGYLS
jgi:hypothetical protein